MLTHLLLPDLKKTGAEENGDARIVVVTCVHNKALARRQQGMSFNFKHTLGKV